MTEAGVPAGWTQSWIGAQDRARLMAEYGACDEDLSATEQLYLDGQRDLMLTRKLRSLPTIAASGHLVFLSPAQVQRLGDELDGLWAAHSA